MTTSSPTADATARLERLQRYLLEDPANPALLADAFETALSCGAHGQAEEWLEAAEALGGDRTQWTFRRARLAIARRDLAGAAALLEGLQRELGEHPAIVHDLAYVRMLQGDLAACRSLLQPWMECRKTDVQGPAEAAVQTALQVLWLRALHRLQLLQEAVDWAREQAESGGLHAPAKGVASLIALDLGDFAAALDWSDAALEADPRQMEALVARACVALAEGQAGDATLFLRRALEINPVDGRAWSTLGLATLQERNLPLAQSQLETAVRHLPGHVGTWHALGWTLLLQGARADALEAFDRALALDRNFAESHGAVGLLLALEGRTADAQHHLDVADRLDARNLTARYARAWLAGDARDRDSLNRLALRLLDRPGFLGGKLSDSFTRNREGPKHPA